MRGLICVRYSPLLKDGETISDLVCGSTAALKLIDFGQSIDMTMFPPDTTFMAQVATEGFQCIEMRTNRPWTYQAFVLFILNLFYLVLTSFVPNGHVNACMDR